MRPERCGGIFFLQGGGRRDRGPVLVRHKQLQTTQTTRTTHSTHTTRYGDELKPSQLGFKREANVVSYLLIIIASGHHSFPASSAMSHRWPPRPTRRRSAAKLPAGPGAKSPPGGVCFGLPKSIKHARFFKGVAGFSSTSVGAEPVVFWVSKSRVHTLPVVPFMCLPRSLSSNSTASRPHGSPALKDESPRTNTRRADEFQSSASASVRSAW